MLEKILVDPNEAPRSKLRAIEAEFAEANPPSRKASAGHLAIPPCNKLQGILAKANEIFPCSWIED